MSSDPWRYLTLSEVAAVERGISWSKEAEEQSAGPGLTPVVRIGNVQRSGLDMGSRLFLRDLPADAVARKTLDASTIIMVGSNGNSERIGNVCRGGEEVAGHVYASFLIGIKSRETEDVDYLFTALQSDPVQRQISEATSGSTGLKNIGLTWLRSLSIPWPGAEERAQIADVARVHAETLASAAAHADAAARLLAALVDELVSDRGDRVATTTLGEVSDIRSGITKGRKAKASVSPRPFLRAANVQDGRLDLGEIHTIDVTETEAARFMLQPGDVLMVEGSGNRRRLGTGWVWEGQIEGCLHQNHVFRARPDPRKLMPRFLAYALGTTAVRDYFAACTRSTSGLATINRSHVLRVPLFLPSPERQEEVLGTLDAARAVAEAARAAEERLNALRNGVVTRLLSRQHEIPDMFGSRSIGLALA